jgi:ATP-dependent Clp protease protease subunit
VPSLPIPNVIERDARGERYSDLFSRLLGQRIVLLGTEIDSTVANLVVAQLVHLESEDPDADVNMYVNSPGGEAYAGLAIYDTMQHIRCDVRTIAYGMAMSMGAVILAGGTAGKRMALPSAKIMIHQGSAGFRGQVTDIEIQAAEHRSVQRRLEEVLAYHTGQPIDRIHQDTLRDRFLTADDARDYGLIDEVLGPRLARAAA